MWNLTAGISGLPPIGRINTTSMRGQHWSCWLLTGHLGAQVCSSDYYSGDAHASIDMATHFWVGPLPFFREKQEPRVVWAGPWLWETTRGKNSSYLCTNCEGTNALRHGAKCKQICSIAARCNCRRRWLRLWWPTHEWQRKQLFE